MKFIEAINRFLVEEIPFVCYRLPETLNPVICVGGSFSRNVPDIDTKYFVFAPFDEDEVSPVLYFPFEKQFEGADIDVLTYFNSPDSKLVFTSSEEPHLSSNIEYQQQANELLSIFQEGRLKKIVLSRVIRKALPENFSLEQMFTELCKKYPAAFVYLLSDGQQLLWMGASPETLLKVEDGLAETMALAGTTSATKVQSENFQWGEKEINEQLFVTLFLRQRLLESGIAVYTERGPQTVFAGNVAHLQTMFYFKIPDQIPLQQLISHLHPTPAVCGLPADEAMQVLRKTEKHKRRYYSGYLGIVESSNNAKIFVNLRCMEIMNKTAFLYVGGGLTSESELESEWNETNLKAETLTSVISNLS
ncbi:MAG: hypothetical protein CVT92_05430 [Bacteroidetes bacterium HGW-Bacteroidetes-1]|jgi:isochorismate synthase|nr:MAG: hypothetical protein CVT92_05430 [Bacteroidetes bacterium HGW-Bacteroidetes-1]